MAAYTEDTPNTAEIPKTNVIDKYVSEILPHLLLCNRAKASNPNIIAAFEVKTVLTVMNSPIEDAKKTPDVDYKFIEMDDECSEDILSHMNTFNEIISSGLQKGNVLVHCLAGISRSVTAIASYLIATLNFTAVEARNIIREGRRWAGPNEGFFNQLGVFEKRVQNEKEGCIVAPPNSQPAQHIQQILADNEKFGDFKLASKLLRERDVDYKVCVTHNQYALHCNSCDKKVVDWFSIISQSYLLSDNDPEDCNAYFTVQDTVTKQTIAHFSKETSENISGYINITEVLMCSCGAELGVSDAYYGVKCKCGAHISPGYQILKDKVYSVSL